ncbi:MAG TPA: DUF1080 domain-containing protein [Gemmatimonadaceae bacterium]|nr:DUF1080 domain-containing protein [Gemmatimonadaceae bacterium]
MIQLSARLLAAAVAAAVTLGGCSSAPQTSGDAQTAESQGGGMNTLTAAERADGWRLLFDGRTTDGWRNYKRETIGDGWQVVDGTLALMGRGGDIITRDQFANFELALEWQLSPAGPAGNSGIFYRASEEPDQIYNGAPEMQILDNERHPDGRSHLTSAGSNYALHGVDPSHTRPAGEWNAVRLVVNGNHVEHWLNGTKVVEYELGSDEWKAAVARSKFATQPEYGRATRGHIGLQDHGSYVAFRNIRIRELP